MADSTPPLERALHQHRSGNLVEAAKGYRKFLRKNPNHPHALYLLGCLEYQNGKNDTATDLLIEAASLAPREADYHNALGLALTALPNYAEAEHSLRRALQLDSRAQFHTNLGLLFRKQNRPADAIASLRQSLALQPDDTDVLCELGDILQETDDFDAASAVYQDALKLNPGLARAWYSAGCAETARHEFVPASVFFQSALDLKPDWLEARHNLARALYEVGQVSAALTHFQLCPIPQSRAMAAVIIPGAPEATNQSILEARSAFAKHDLPMQDTKPPIRPRVQGDRLRIGYVSSFFQRDNWMKPVWGLINEHDRDNFLVNLFSDAPVSNIRHGYRPHLKDRFFNTTSLSNEGLAHLIREAEIDILIDLNGFSNMRRLPLYTFQPAPVIVGWFNLYATTGLSCFDYLIGDSTVIPPNEEAFYSEKLLRVPGSYLSFSVDYPVPPVSDPPLSHNCALTFGSLASQYKLTHEVISAWSRILEQTPNSSLLLKNKHLASPTTRQFVHTQFESHGIAATRVTLEGPEDHFAFLKAYDRIDIALDPFPYNGGTTTTEALWQGVPVVAFYGDRWSSRTSASILRAAGLENFVAHDVESYIGLASQLGNDPASLRELRPTMRAKLSQSPLCDTLTFARQMESLYSFLTRSKP